MNMLLNTVAGHSPRIMWPPRHRLLCVPSSVPVQFAMDDPANEDLFATPDPSGLHVLPRLDALCTSVNGWVRALGGCVGWWPCVRRGDAHGRPPLPVPFLLARRSWLASSCGCLTCLIQCSACSTGSCIPSPPFEEPRLQPTRPSLRLNNGEPFGCTLMCFMQSFGVGSISHRAAGSVPSPSTTSTTAVGRSSPPPWCPCPGRRATSGPASYSNSCASSRICCPSRPSGR